ncbi:MAG: hypothetical protein Q3984_03070 [Eubacteriales bacterium]|nr:hypothetical protein [Eubacteriales bacterium]
MPYRKDKNSTELSILGYGCMRFSKKGSGVARAFMLRRAPEARRGK